MNPQLLAPPPTAPLTTVPSTPIAPPAETTDYNLVYGQICAEIIRQQADIIGAELAVQQAAGVSGLGVDPVTLNCVISGDGASQVAALVEVYRGFFGDAALEVCRDAAARFIGQLAPEQVPAVLRAGSVVALV